MLRRLDINWALNILTRYDPTKDHTMLAELICDWWTELGKDIVSEAELTSQIGTMLVAYMQRLDYTGAQIDKVLGAGPSLREGFLAIKAAEKARPKGLQGWIAAVFAGLGYLFGTSLLGWFAGIGHAFVTGFLSHTAMWVFHALVRAGPDRALWVAKEITSAYYTLPIEWAGFISEYLERLTGATIKLDDIKGMPVTGGSRDAMIALGKTFLDPMLGLIMPTPEEAEAKPMRGAEAFMSANLQFQMSAWLLHLLGDTMSFGMFKSLKDLPNAISWSYGIGWLSWMVMGPIFRAGITAHMEKKFARYYRYENLTNAQIVDAYYAGRKTAEETSKELSERALKDTDIETLIHISRKRFSETQMEYMVKKGWKDEKQVIQYYKDMSFTEADAEAMAERLLTKTTRDYTEKIVSRIEDLYKAHIVSPEEMRRYYRDIDLSQEEQDLALTELDLQMVGTATLTPAQIARLYQGHHISYEQALDRLLPRYADPNDAALFLKLYPAGEE